MTALFFTQLVLFVVILTVCSIVLGAFIASVFRRSRNLLSPVIDPLVNLHLCLGGKAASCEMTWREYANSFLLFNVIGVLFVYLIQRVQGVFPLNPAGLGAVSSDSSFNTAISFATNTNWQGYAGEATMSYLTQMLALTSQNFVSAASGIAVLFALIRGFTRSASTTIGNFWEDLLRSTLFILLPLSFATALLLASQGVVQTFSQYVTATPLAHTGGTDGDTAAAQIIALGPVASQVAIKQLGTNGGGYFNTNSAHPLENPTPFSNLVELLAILLIPGALCFTFGKLVGRASEGWVLYGAMLIIWAMAVLPCAWIEQGGNPFFAKDVDLAASDLQPGGNFEGKELRHGVSMSVLWAVSTTAASNGSVNAMHDSFLPLAGLFPMLMMQLGEVVFGGVGSGLYGMIAFALVAVFIAGLMVGRTPEYLGKKIGAFEMKMVSLIVLIPCALTLIGTAFGVAFPSLHGSISNPGPHGLSQVLYAYSSMGNNNGSAFAGFGANIPFHNLVGGIAMFIARYWLAIPTLALAAALAKKNIVPAGPGTLATDTPLFLALLIGVVLIVGALTFFPALALGPIAEQLLMQSH